jgi:transposase
MAHLKAEQRTEPAFPQIKKMVAGIDIGSGFHMVAIPEHLDSEPVRKFDAHTPGLINLVGFLKEKGIVEAAMEATGVYWVPLFNLLEEAGIKPTLLNPRSLKAIPKKKSDVMDCRWILKVFSHGLVEGCFVPDAQTAGLRELVRARAKVVADAADHTNRMIRTLRLMNVNLEKAVSDIQGETGMRIIRAIVDGERNPLKLAQMRDPRCKLPVLEIAKHLDGVYEGYHLATLRQNLDFYDSALKAIHYYDAEILSYMRTIPTSPRYDEKKEGYVPVTLGEYSKDISRVTQERSTGRLFAKESGRILGVDLTAIEGIGPNAILTFISEIGTCVGSFESAGKLASFLGLAPGCDISGGKRLSKGTRKVIHRLSQALRMAAMSLWRSKSYLGAFFRKMRARQGTPKAITTTAHKLLRLMYGMVKNGKDYVKKLAEAEEAKNRERQVKGLMDKARTLGLEVIDPSTGEVLG